MVPDGRERSTVSIYSPAAFSAHAACAFALPRPSFGSFFFFFFCSLQLYLLHPRALFRAPAAATPWSMLNGPSIGNYKPTLDDCNSALARWERQRRSVTFGGVRVRSGSEDAALPTARPAWGAWAPTSAIPAMQPAPVVDPAVQHALDSVRELHRENAALRTRLASLESVAALPPTVDDPARRQLAQALRTIDALNAEIDGLRTQLSHPNHHSSSGAPHRDGAQGVSASSSVAGGHCAAAATHAASASSSASPLAASASLPLPSSARSHRVILVGDVHGHAAPLAALWGQLQARCGAPNTHLISLSSPSRLPLISLASPSHLPLTSLAS
jgi:hypothetical protein